MAINIFERLFSLNGKCALITGGYQGIGRLFAETYAEAGASVAVVARNSEGCRRAAAEISEKFGVPTIGKSMDVRIAEEVDRVVREVYDEFGRIDILVNSAGIAGSQKPILKMEDLDLDDVMNTDFRGIFITSKAVARYMAEEQSGRIINIASIFGKIAVPSMSGYCASKAAVIHLTKVMALEMIRNNIQVNVLCPGYFLTELNREFFDSEAGKNLVKVKIPIKRAGDLEELRSTALYLATCPDFMTGTELCIDGGHILP